MAWQLIEDKVVELSHEYLSAFDEMHRLVKAHKEFLGLPRMVISTMTLGAKFGNARKSTDEDMDEDRDTPVSVQDIVRAIYDDADSPFRFASTGLGRLHEMAAENIMDEDIAQAVLELGKKSTGANILQINEELKLIGHDPSLEHLILTRERRVFTKSTKRSKTFKNQYTLYHGSIALFVFKKGTLHATGCKSLVEFLNVIDDLLPYIPATCDQPLQFYNIKMINFNMCLTKTLSLARLVPILKASIPDSTVYISDMHPPIHLTFPSLTDPAKKLTCFVHRSGAISLTAHHPRDIVFAVKTIIEVLSAHPEIMSATSKKKSIATKANDFKLKRGYSARFFDQCIFSQ